MRSLPLPPSTRSKATALLLGFGLLAAPCGAEPAAVDLEEAPLLPPVFEAEITLEEQERQALIAQGTELGQASGRDGEFVPPPPVLDDDIWSGTLEFYGYLPTTTNTYTTVRGTEAEASLSLQDLLEKLGFAAAGRASVEKGRLGLLLDADYVRIGAQGVAIVGPRQGLRRKAEIAYTQGFYDLALRYRFGPRESAVGEAGQFTLMPYAGARLVDLRWDLDASVEFLPRRFVGPRGNTFDLPGRTLLDLNRSASHTWVQPLVGAQASWHLTPRLRAFGRADIAGFDLAGEDDISYNLQAGLGYAIGNSTALNVSWRTRGVSWNNGNDPDNGYRAYNYGIEAGVKFFFGGAPSAAPVTASVPPAPMPEPEPAPAPMPEAAPMPEPVRGLW